MLESRIENIPDKKLVGKRMRMSLSDDKTFIMWQSFMSHKKEIANRVSEDYFSVTVYDNFEVFTQCFYTTLFDKWATAEVSEFNGIPDGMEGYTLPGGLYAVFLYKGGHDEFSTALQYIFGTWMPASGYVTDDRPHFEILGEKYKLNDSSSEEEVWIPIRP